jgi:hypothetical protein
MRLSPLIMALAALAALIVVGFVGARVLQPNRPLLADVSISPSKITPNADGLDDVTSIHYTVNRNAKVTIAFTAKADGKRYVFRDAQERAAGSYGVDFSGVVDGYTLPGETTVGDVQTRLVPNGDYTWTIEAAAVDSNETTKSSGDFSVADADSALPAINDFSVSPQAFTPNQDGVDDRISINVYLAKASTLTVYLLGKNQQRYYVPEHVGGRKPGDPGQHLFDYDGGVDNNEPPPPDGTYSVVAEAQDAVGQRVSRTGSVSISEGGLPHAEFAAQAGSGSTVYWNTLPYKDSYMTNLQTAGETVPQPQGVTSTLATLSMPKDDLLVFRVTVSNYGSTPIRTFGPWPGTVYQYNQTDAAMGNDFKSGGWRVGIMCEGSETNFPWRWAIGSQDQLTKVDRDGQTFWYLDPGKTAVVWGAVRMTKLIVTRNPQECWAGLIHEDVTIPDTQGHVGPIKVTLTQATTQ